MSENLGTKSPQVNDAFLDHLEQWAKKLNSRLEEVKTKTGDPHALLETPKLLLENTNEFIRHAREMGGLFPILPYMRFISFVTERISHAELMDDTKTIVTKDPHKNLLQALSDLVNLQKKAANKRWEGREELIIEVSRLTKDRVIKCDRPSWKHNDYLNWLLEHYKDENGYNPFKDSGLIGKDTIRKTVIGAMEELGRTDLILGYNK